MEEILSWLLNLGLKLVYRGEGLPRTAQGVLLHLLAKKERVYLTGEEKAELLDAYGHSRAVCGASGPLEWDHKQALCTSMGRQTPDSFQPLCDSCHTQKTDQESKEFDVDLLQSNFEHTVYDAYVRYPRPPALVWKRKETDAEACHIADVRRCRTNALLQNPYPVPVFSPFNVIEKVTDFMLGDVNFVTKGQSNVCCQLGYTQGRSHRAAVEFWLHNGVIRWSDVKRRSCATTHYPADIFRQPLDTMEEAWTGIEGGKALAKIGLQQYHRLVAHRRDATGVCVRRWQNLRFRAEGGDALNHEPQASARFDVVSGAGFRGLYALRATTSQSHHPRAEDGQCSVQARDDAADVFARAGIFRSTCIASQIRARGPIPEAAGQ